MTDEVALEANNPNTNITVVQRFFGIIRLIHVLPVFFVTFITAVLTFFALDGFKPHGAFITTTLTVFFQQAFIGTQNDYIDREKDSVFGKQRAIALGWVSPRVALWAAVSYYVIFTCLSFVLALFVRIGFWIVLYLQAANIICMLYNVYLKETVFSFLPFLIGFPLVPGLVWLSFGNFELKYLWYIPMMVFVGLATHIANELPDYQLDKQYQYRNFSTIFGERTATIVYLVFAFLAELLLIGLVFFYEFNLILYAVIISLSAILGAFAIFGLWKKRWKTDTFVFNLFTVFMGFDCLGLVLLVNII
ncbi:MAG: UbiA family prenyltransferase [Candidatus Heimdallarchaeota archaeon]